MGYIVRIPRRNASTTESPAVPLPKYTLTRINLGISTPALGVGTGPYLDPAAETSGRAHTNDRDKTPIKHTLLYILILL